MDHWHERTCIRFEPYDNVRHRNYRARLFMQTNESSFCASAVGYREDAGPNYLSDIFLGTDCSIGSIIHELGHAIGFRHEQSRVDRNKHIKINYKLIEKGFESQYDIMESPQPGYYGVQYDLFSIMHYSSQGNVLEALDPKRTFLMGQRVGLSFLDTKLANIAYKCSEKCHSVQCQNEGFLDQYCKCYCPDGFTGQLCETVVRTGADRKS
jgi:Astacin (Peptidase family M12A)